VINGVHAIIHSKDPDGLRAFFRDTLGMASVDAGGGWPIFALPPAELGIHPDGGPTRHELYLLCDDIAATVDTLRGRGVEFTEEVHEERWGLVTALRLPDGSELAVYQPRHPTAHPLGG
jgi:catechol 2,3-dioxygenase-like lactoylglutathione lyase family enzyme